MEEPSSGDFRQPVSPEEQLRRICQRLERGSSTGTEPTIIEFYRRSKSELHSSVQNLIKSYLIIPASSVHVERLFSSLKFIMKGRPQLTTGKLNEIALIRNYCLQPDFSLDVLVKLMHNTVVETPTVGAVSEVDEPPWEEPDLQELGGETNNIHLLAQ